MDETAPLDEAIAVMGAGKLSSLVITSTTGITGIFTTADAMRAFVEILRS